MTVDKYAGSWTSGSFHEIIRHIVPWFGFRLSRVLRMPPMEAVKVFGQHMENEFGGVDMFDLKGLTVEQWYKETEGLDDKELHRQGYRFYTRYPVPSRLLDKLRSFQEILQDSIMEVYTPQKEYDWFFDLDRPHEAHMFGEWIALKKADFIRSVERNYKRKLREKN